MLDSVADILAKRPAFDIEVRGYTDSIGSDDYNLDLFRRRAEAVRDFLVAKGIPQRSSRPWALARPSRLHPTTPPMAAP